MTNEKNYQDTLCDWVGEIPKHWNMTRGRFLFKSKKEINRELQCENLLSLTLNGVLNKDFQSTDGLRPENYNTYQIFQKDDLVFKMIDLENVKTSRVGLVHEEGIMSPVYIRHEPIKEKINSKFAYWFYYDLYKKEIYNSIGSGVRSSLSSSDLLEIELPVPPLVEQKLISRYLDKKTSQIDSLVKKVHKKIDLLKEQRTSLINHYVTKGLNPNVEMKDSGVEWIGEIPKHWEVTRLKYHGEVLVGLSFDKDDMVDEGQGTLVLRSSNVQNGQVNFSDNVWVNTDVPDKLFVQKGDILICSRNGSRNLIGKNCLLDQESLGMTWGVFMSVFRSRYSEFFYWILNSQVFKSQSGLFLTSTINQLTVSTLENLVFPFVSDRTEQNRINELLKKETKSIDELIDREQRRISLLMEYRQSLISSVVTGKVQVTEDMI